jgi:RNA polymerase sigma-70 factor (ECF subfamily)
MTAMISGLAMCREEETGCEAEIEQAVARLRGRKLDALATLIPIYQNRLYRYLIRLLRDPSTAEDLFQQTWLQVASNIRRYDSRRSFDHWLFAVAHNLAVDFLKRRKPEALDEASFAGGRNGTGPATALDRLLDSERSAALLSAVGELPATYREVLALRFEHELKIGEIAGVLGAPLSTVKSRLRRALESLREKLG